MVETTEVGENKSSRILVWHGSSGGPFCHRFRAEISSSIFFKFLAEGSQVASASNLAAENPAGSNEGAEKLEGRNSEVTSADGLLACAEVGRTTAAVYSGPTKAVANKIQCKRGAGKHAAAGFSVPLGKIAGNQSLCSRPKGFLRGVAAPDFQGQSTPTSSSKIAWKLESLVRRNQTSSQSLLERLGCG